MGWKLKRAVAEAFRTRSSRAYRRRLQTPELVLAVAVPLLDKIPLPPCKWYIDYSWRDSCTSPTQDKSPNLAGNLDHWRNYRSGCLRFDYSDRPRT